MLASEIIGRENAVHQGYAADGEVSPGKQGAVDLFDYKPHGRSDYFYDQQVAKDLIVLHYTQGYLWGDLDTLTQTGNHVSVAFVIGRTGRIYRLFDPRLWSYHLGPGTVGGNQPNSRRSIGIEVSNLGFLKKDGNTLRFGNSPYCTADQTQYYMDHGTDYRGQRYYATFTAEQYVSLNALVNQLSTEFGIGKTVLPAAQRLDVFASDDEAKAFKGIATHVNFRPDGKWDIGPGFDWTKIGV